MENLKIEGCPGNKNHVGGMLHRTSHEIRRALDARVMNQLGPEMTGMWGLVLGYIQRCTELGGDVYQRDVEARFHIRRSSVTALLQGMEQKGLLIRCPVAQDARLKKLVLTPAGEEAHRQIGRVIDQFETELQEGITPEEVAALRATLTKLAENVYRMEQGDTPELQKNQKEQEVSEKNSETNWKNKNPERGE